MKFVISFLFLMGLEAVASPIRIFHEDQPDRAEIVRGIFLQGYQIPEDLMLVRGVVKCEELRGRGKLDLCLKNNGDLLVVSVDKGFIHESLKIFQSP